MYLIERQTTNIREEIDNLTHVGMRVKVESKTLTVPLRPVMVKVHPSV
jgi:hypothetical protein